MNHLFVSTVCWISLSILITSARPPFEGTHFLFKIYVNSIMFKGPHFSLPGITPLRGCPDTDPICPDIASKMSHKFTVCADIATKTPHKLVPRFIYIQMGVWEPLGWPRECPSETYAHSRFLTWFLGSAEPRWKWTPTVTAESLSVLRGDRRGSYEWPDRTQQSPICVTLSTTLTINLIPLGSNFFTGGAEYECHQNNNVLTRVQFVINSVWTCGDV